jgi:alkaline phosphatase D
MMRAMISRVLVVGLLVCAATACTEAESGEATDTRADSDSTGIAGTDAGWDVTATADATIEDVFVDPGEDVALVPEDTASDTASDTANAPDVPDVQPLDVEDTFMADPDAGDAGSPETGPEGPVVELETDITVLGDAFPLGVSSGAARAESATFLARYSGEAVVLTLRVWRPLADSDDVILAFGEEVVVGDGGYVKVRVTGLAADKQYQYAFFVESTGRSPIGTVQTALAPGSSRTVRFAATSCTRGTFAPFPALTRMSEAPIDGVIHLGDISYNDGANTLADYRSKWAETLETQGYRDLLAAGGLYTTWDDHEVENNWNAETINADKLAAATDSYFETLPNEAGPDNRIWHRYEWGDAVEIFILDSRSERLPSTLGSESPQYISPEQMDWLTVGLMASTAHFKVILSSVPITDMPIWYFGEDDRWEGYQSQRTELLEFIAQNGISGTWFLGGDFHIGFVSQLNISGLGSNLREVAVGPGGNFNPVGLISFPPEQFPFSHGDPAAATWLTFDPEADTVRVEFESAITGGVLLDQTYPGSL